MIHISAKIVIGDEKERFLGSGPYRLLRLTEQLGSLRQAAMRMDMSYSKAHNLIKRLECSLGREVLQCRVGGATGGGAVLTEFGQLLLREYERLSCAVQECAEGKFAEFCRVLGIPYDSVGVVNSSHFTDLDSTLE